MQINEARYEEGDLILKVPPQDAKLFTEKFKAGNYTIKRHEKKRSMDANAYCWVLIGKISEVIGDSPNDIYRRYVRDVGSMVRVTCVPVKDVEAECREFIENHIGRMVEVGESKLDGCATVKKYYGSSNYTVKQMSRFVDVIVEDCKLLSIETRTDEEIRSLLEGWDDK